MVTIKLEKYSSVHETCGHVRTCVFAGREFGGGVDLGPKYAKKEP